MTYTFNITKNTTNPFSISNERNESKAIDALLMSNLKKNIPYLFNEDDEDEILTFIPKKKKSKDFMIFTPKKDKKTIDITITKNAKHNGITFDEFRKAFNYLSNNGGDTYDFKLDDGTPIKIFSDEIQIGYELLPLNDATKRIYNALSETRKKNIIDIYINIKR